MSSELVTCEVCPNQVPEADIKLFMTIRMCLECYEKEKQLQASHNEPAAIQQRVDDTKSPWNATLQKAKEIDDSIEVRTDLFNAETVALVQIKAAIENDENIEGAKKQFTYVKTIEQRIEDYQKKIFELGEEMVRRQNELKSAVTMFNNEVIKLREAERAQFKLQSINYDPKPIKKISETKPKGTSKKTPKRDEVRTAAAVIQQFISDNKIPLAIKITEDLVQIVCVSQNLTPDQAIEYYKDKFRPMIPAKQ